MNMSHPDNGSIVLKPFCIALCFFLIDRPCCARPKLRQMWTRTIAGPFIREQGSDTLHGHPGPWRMPGTRPEPLTLLQTHLISRDAMQWRGRHLQRPALPPKKCRRLSRSFAERPQSGLWIEWRRTFEGRPDCRTETDQHLEWPLQALLDKAPLGWAGRRRPLVSWTRLAISLGGTKRERER